MAASQIEAGKMTATERIMNTIDKIRLDKDSKVKPKNTKISPTPWERVTAQLIAQILT